MTKRSFILSSCHQVLSLGGVRADDNAADEERSSEINGEGCAHLSIHSSFFEKTSIHVMHDVRIAKEKIYSSRSAFLLSQKKRYICPPQVHKHTAFNTNQILKLDFRDKSLVKDN